MESEPRGKELISSKRYLRKRPCVANYFKESSRNTAIYCLAAFIHNRDGKRRKRVYKRSDLPKKVVRKVFSDFQAVKFPNRFDLPVTEFSIKDIPTLETAIGVNITVFELFINIDGFIEPQLLRRSPDRYKDTCHLVHTAGGFF